MSRRFVSYLRVSTGRQGVSGLGLEAQREAVSQYTASVAGEIIQEFLEVESGKIRDRPILAEALKTCRATKAVLVIAKLDRLARNVAFVSSLMEAGVEFVAADMPAATRLTLHIMAAFAEHEREQIGARTRDALAAAKARGVRLGANGARLAEARQAEATAFAEALRPVIERLYGEHLTLAVMASRLGGLGVLTREGSTWTPTAVRRVLVRLGLHPASQGSVGPPPPPTSPFPKPGPFTHHATVGGCP